MTERDIVTGAITALTAIAGALGADRAWHRLRSNGLSERVGRMEVKVDALDGKVDKIDRSIAYIEGRFRERDRGRRGPDT